MVRPRRQIVVLVLVACFCLSVPGSGPAASTGVGPASTVTGGTWLPPAYLMWRTGGLPAGLTPRLNRLPGVQQAVVVAGDTLWMRRSARAGGGDVDAVSAPYGIPLEVMATNARAMARFVPAAWRPAVIDTLRADRAIMGGSSAALRRLGVGDRVVFRGGERITVGAIVPDEVASWSELMVARDVGRSLGVKHDRFALLDMNGDPSGPRLARMIDPLLGPGYPPRIRKPGHAEFRRQGDAVWPPILMKEGFGEFAAYPDPRNPGYLRMHPSFVHRHLVSMNMPLLGRFTCHESLYRPLIRAIARLRNGGHAGAVRNFAGCYNARMVMRRPTGAISHHAWGAAVDINSISNPYGAQPHQPPVLVAAMASSRFTWGGRWTVPDGMHFEYVGIPGVG